MAGRASRCVAIPPSHPAGVEDLAREADQPGEGFGVQDTAREHILAHVLALNLERGGHVAVSRRLKTNSSPPASK